MCRAVIDSRCKGALLYFAAVRWPLLASRWRRFFKMVSCSVRTSPLTCGVCHFRCRELKEYPAYIPCITDLVCFSSGGNDVECSLSSEAHRASQLIDGLREVVARRSQSFGILTLSAAP